MKNYRFPSHASRTNELLRKITSTRAALILVLVASLSSLPFYVLAQDDSAPVKSRGSASYRPAPESGAFIISQGPGGETDCRQATAEEARALRVGSVKQELHQINHLKTGAPQSNAPESAPGLTINLRATAQLEANQPAKQAFIAAAAKWESLIKDPITINIDVDYGTTFFGTAYGAGILGQTETQLLYSPGNFTDIRQRLINHATGSEGTLYAALPTTTVPSDIGSVDTVLLATPLMRALGLLQPIADDSEQGGMIGPAPRIGFNSNFGFDFDPSDGITSTLTDFDAVAVHEMGHALGFNSLVGDREETPTNPLAVSVWDIFRFRPGTATLNTFSTAQRILSSGGTQIHFSGGPELGLSTGKPSVPVGGDGNQGSHWKADEQGGVFIGVMDPTIARGQRYTMTTNDQNAIDAFGFTIVATPAPPNDNFANAQVLSGSSGTVNGTSSFATKEAGEPTNPPGTGGGRSVWYNWTATGTGQATFDTNGSSFDTILAAYTGSAVNALTVLASNDDISPLNDPPPRNIQSLITFSVTAGTTYRIQVDGFDGDQGSIVLHWTGPGTPTPTPTPTPGPNTVQFSAGTASATETAGATTKVDLLVTRTGNTAAAATVNYATSNGTASDRSDYEATLGTLQFAGGETSKTVTVFIVDDAFGETPETFSVILSNPVACTLGAQTAVTVTINSNELVNGANPVKNASFNNDFFVRQHYLDFLNREPDSGGLNFWKGQLNECEGVPLPGGFTDAQVCRETRRINVSAAFFLSIEFQQTGYLVERLYKVAYGDAVGTSTFGGTHQLAVPIVRLNEFLSDTQAMGKGVVIGAPGADQLLEANKQAVIADFVQRSRFLTAHPLAISPGQFVNDLSNNAGSGVLSPSERNQLINDLTLGNMTRAQVLRAIAEDSDLFASEKNRAFVLTQFIGYLRRNPNDPPEAGLDYTGYDFWLGKLNQFNGNFVNAEMVKAFIVSGEYQGRFGP
ncbi:MAG TPA: NF038122 family metalloprotease [Pyrinomonadaceae bacterium]|nr:NF038122 family metalloprotease [Pyrinomonadaceae bacterium]